MPKIDQPKLKSTTTLLCVFSIVLMATSQFLPWVSWVDVETNIGGVADIRLNADFYSYKIEYEAEAEVEAGMLGGFLGGFGNIANIGSDGTVGQSDTVFYWEGMDRLQGMVGLLYDTSRDVHYSINPKTWNSTNTWVRVGSHVDLIPWWPEGIGQDLTITVTLNTTDNVKEVRVNKVWITLFKDWNPNERDYEQSSDIWEIEPNDVLTQEGDTAVYSHSVTVYKDWGDKIGMVGLVDITLIDNEDQEDHSQLKSYPSTSHPRTINVIPQTQGQLVSVLLMFMAMPVAIIGMVFSGVALLLTFFQKRRRMHMLFAAGVLDWLSVAFFMIGSSSLVNMIDLIKEEWFVYNLLGLSLPFIAGLLLFVVFFLEMKYGAKDEAEPSEPAGDEIKFDISGALTEEEEVDEGFECPACGREFTEMVSECPECGAEFEGLEEDEEDKEIEEEAEKEEEERGADE